MTQAPPAPASFTPDDQSLDPADWTAFREMGHRMLDDMVDFMAGVRERPVWQPMPADVRAALKSPLPRAAGDLNQAYDDFQQLVQPYIGGNIHPRFLGWVHGAGNPVGVLAEMLAATLNANLGGRDHAPIEVEREVIRWSAEMIGFPATTTGVLVTGTSVANLIALLVARTQAMGRAVRTTGMAGHKLVAYTSPATHNCVLRAMDMAGLGTQALRLIPFDGTHRICLDTLRQAIAADRAAGLQPFMVIGTAGTVDTGAIDDLASLAALCKQESLWFHVDAAFGALAVLSPAHRPLLAGIEQADSIAFDFHKWAQVPYDAGCVLVRNGEAHAAAFATHVNYLQRETRGLAAGHPWPTDFGPDLSRGFRALKVWMTLKVYGADKLGQVVAQCCDLAKQLEQRVRAEPELAMLSPVWLNVACFRYIGASQDLDRLNAEIVIALQESGIAVPSTTKVDGQLAIRLAFVNHRTRPEDIDILIDAVLDAGRRLGAA